MAGGERRRDGGRGGARGGAAGGARLERVRAAAWGAAAGALLLAGARVGGWGGQGGGLPRSLVQAAGPDGVEEARGSGSPRPEGGADAVLPPASGAPPLTGPSGTPPQEEPEHEEWGHEKWEELERDAKERDAWKDFDFPKCQPEEWDERIRSMLAPWARVGGIDRKDLLEAVRDRGYGCFPTPEQKPLECEEEGTGVGVGVGFYGGEAYFLADNMTFRGEAGQIVMGHLHMMLELEGRNIPDVEFLLQGTDASFPPDQREKEKPRQQSKTKPPVMHYCTYPDLFDELLVPGDWWFMVQNFDEHMLAYDPDKAKPWSEREEVLACNCGGYHRYDVDPDRRWRGLGGIEGYKLRCPDKTLEDKAALDFELQRDFCPSPRLYYENYLAREWRPDILKSDYLSRNLSQWDEVKYILFLDGITCSTRLQQYLNLGMSTFIEQSGYQQYYQHFMEPWKHYVPVWNQSGPADLVDKVEWAKSHDLEAKALGENAFDFARETFKPERRLCYWESLLRAYAHLQKSPPEKPPWAVRVRDHLYSRPGCHEIEGASWSYYNDAYKVGPKHGKEPWAPRSEFCHPAAQGYDDVADPRPAGGWPNMAWKGPGALRTRRP